MADDSPRASMADVAAHAGVSAQTVSRVLNGSAHVDPGTRVRVEAAMATLDYRPHRAARALRTGRTQTIGVIAQTLATVGNSRMLQAVAEAAATCDYSVVVVTLGGGSDAGRSAGDASGAGAAPVGDAFRRLRDQGVDGAIVLNEATRLAREAVVPTDLRLVVVDSPADDRFDVVQTDHVAGARDAVAHLLSQGHRTVAHVTGPAGAFAADQRERGWRDALSAAGVPRGPLLHGDWSAASGYARGALLAVDLDVTAVFCANDQMALGLLRALADAGRRVPDDVSVIGFDDSADAAQFRPPLTTMRQDFAALGARAVDTLVSGVEGPAARVVETIPARLIVRASTAPPVP